MTGYLQSKRSVDDRALSRSVLSALTTALAARSGPRPLRVLELGAGEGTMIARAIEWNLVGEAEYTAVDADGAAISRAARELPRWAERRGLRAKSGDGEVSLTASAGRVKVRLCHEDLFAFSGDGRPFDLLIASAVLDLVDVERALPRLWGHLRPGGLFWFPINFDGDTIFGPERDAKLENQIVGLYHRSMDERTPDGSRTGRRLFSRLGASGARVLAAGASDWVVHPVDGRYPHDEADFLRHIIDTIEGELSGHPELDPRRFRHWVDTRRADIDAAELVYIAHQLDFVGRAPGG